MRTTVFVIKRGNGYAIEVSAEAIKEPAESPGEAAVLLSWNLHTDPYTVASRAARFMIVFARKNPLGCSLMAPEEVMIHVPVHLREIDGHAERPS